MWAAFMAIENSLRGSAGIIQQPHQDLYQLYGSGNYHADFHDVTTGSEKLVIRCHVCDLSGEAA